VFVLTLFFSPFYFYFYFIIKLSCTANKYHKMNQFYTYFMLIFISSICCQTSVTLASDTERDRPISKKRPRSVFAASHAQTFAHHSVLERAKLSDLPDRVREMYNMEDEQYKQYSIHTQEQIEKGKAEGIAEGIAEGKAEGIEIGESKTFCTLIQQMRKDNKSDRKIKKWLSLSDEKFEEYVRLIK
jgi:hypothetical protein